MAQADGKALMLIQLNGGMISILLALSLTIHPIHRWFYLPVGVQMAGSVAVMVISLLATKPRYFGSHVISQLMKDHETGALSSFAKPMLYWDLIVDTHRQAKMLAIKFKYLRIAYHVFLVGLLLSILCTVVATMVVR